MFFALTCFSGQYRACQIRDRLFFCSVFLTIHVDGGNSGIVAAITDESVKEQPRRTERADEKEARDKCSGVKRASIVERNVLRFESGHVLCRPESILRCVAHYLLAAFSIYAVWYLVPLLLTSFPVRWRALEASPSAAPTPRANSGPIRVSGASFAKRADSAARDGAV